MTTVRHLRSDARRQTGTAQRVAGVWSLLLLGLLTATVAAQHPKAHLQHAGALPPGAIGNQRLLRGGPVPGYFQPVAVHAPIGTMISAVVEGGFDAAQPAPLLAGMMIAPVYRLRVTNIPDNPGGEVYPTVEVIDRLYPPPGEALRFPIRIDLTQEDLELALAGKFVTRVVYVENPGDAIPHAERDHEQNWFEAAAFEDPLEVADRLGRPVAIIRLGARVPGADGPDEAFLYGSPPLMRFEPGDQPNIDATERFPHMRRQALVPRATQ